MDNKDSQDSIYAAPSADLSIPDDNAPVKIERIIKHPLSPKNLRDIFFFPKRFFAANTAIEAKLSIFFVVWLSGIVYSIDQIETRANKAYIKDGNLDQYAGIVDSWSFYVGTIIGSGLISAGILWLVGGWWYKTRIRFCGVKDPDPSVAREVLFYSNLPYISGMLLMLVTSILRYDNYADEFYSDYTNFELPIYFIPLIMLVWTVIISYIGVKTKFKLSGVAPAIWFLILPLLVYIGALGLYSFILFQQDL